MSKKLLSLAIIAICFFLSTPVMAAEINLGGGTPLWDTHSDDENTNLDGKWLFFASIDRPTKAKPWLSYGLMYNYARIDIKVTETETKWEYRKWESIRECDGDCQPIPNPSVTTTTTISDELGVHVLGFYAKPTWQMTKHLKSFVTVGAGGMYVDGIYYGDEFGGAGFASVGFGVDITEHLGLNAQMLYVKGFTDHVDEIDYLAPVATISYRW